MAAILPRPQWVNSSSRQYMQLIPKTIVQCIMVVTWPFGCVIQFFRYVEKYISYVYIGLPFIIRAKIVPGWPPEFHIMLYIWGMVSWNLNRNMNSVKNYTNMPAQYRPLLVEAIGILTFLLYEVNMMDFSLASESSIRSRRRFSTWHFLICKQIKYVIKMSLKFVPISKFSN